MVDLWWTFPTILPYPSLYLLSQPVYLLSLTGPCGSRPLVRARVKRWVPAEEDAHGPAVLQSANKLFFKIRASLTRCAKMISRGQTLLVLAEVFKVGGWLGASVGAQVGA